MLTETNCKWMFRGLVMVCLTLIIVTALVMRTPLAELWDAIKLIAMSALGG